MYIRAGKGSDNSGSTRPKSMAGLRRSAGREDKQFLNAKKMFGIRHFAGNVSFFCFSLESELSHHRYVTIDINTYPACMYIIYICMYIYFLLKNISSLRIF